MQVFFVGDVVQTIYQFRGSNQTNMVHLQETLNRLLPPIYKNKTLTCLTLTQSFRFGPNIAAVANVFALAKKLSKQKDLRLNIIIVIGNENQGNGVVTNCDFLKTTYGKWCICTFAKSRMSNCSML